MAIESSDISNASGNSQTVVISFLLVTHNSQSVLPGLMSSLQQHPPASSWELIVVDNHSDDGGADFIQSHIVSATVIRCEKNRGFAWGVNRAAESARGRYLCLVNPDIEWPEGAIEQLRTCLDQHADVAAVAPKLLYPDGRLQMSLRRFPTHSNIWLSRGTPWWRISEFLFGRGSYTCAYPDEPSQVEAVAAACLMIQANTFRELGGFDAGYFLYVEDTDFCKRVHDSGAMVWCDPRVAVRHHWGEGTRRDPNLAGFHRDGIRRYFRKFHPEKVIRNSVLFAALWMADKLRSGRETSPDGRDNV